MKNNKAIVTLVLGEQYLQCWKQDCEANWRDYANKHGYDIICAEEPFDTSERAKSRSPSWQKCLILGQEFSRQYDRVVWVDSDILINTQRAPSIVDEVPEDRVGAVEMFCYSKRAGSSGREALRRMFEFWQLAVINEDPQDYYTKYGLSAGFDSVVQAGVLVLSPARHRTLLEKVYYEYEDKGGAQWHHEMRPLSYELLKAGVVHWIDPRFNSLWLDCIFLHYPFLLTAVHPQDVLGKAARKVGQLFGCFSPAQLRHTCATAAFFNSYFLHFGGSELSDMEGFATSVNHESMAE
jgi:hypothetical protein